MIAGFCIWKGQYNQKEVKLVITFFTLVGDGRARWKKWAKWKLPT